MFQIVISDQYEGAQLIPAGEGARGPDCHSEIQVKSYLINGDGQYCEDKVGITSG